MKVTSTTSTQTDPRGKSATTQTDISIETGETYEYSVSRVNPDIIRQEEMHPNIEPSTMTGLQLEASHEIIVEEIVATIDKQINTEAEENTPL